MAVKPIPEGYHTVTPYLVVEKAEDLLTFMKNGLGAQELFVMHDKEGRISHGEVRIGDSPVMFANSTTEYGVRKAMLYLYVPDVDQTYKTAVAAGGKSVREPQTMFYGDRNAAVEDSNGIHWGFATHVEDVSEEELKRRAQAAGK